MRSLVSSELGNRYKIILRHGDGWRDYDSARLHISVPAEPVLDIRIQSIIEWSCKSFEQVTLYLHDSIQRYNLMADGLSEQESYRKAIENGDLWLRNNILPGQVFIDVVRWDQLIEHQDYATIQQQVINLYKTNPRFAASVDHDLKTFADRCRKRGEIFGPDRINLSRSFLLEEVSAYIPLYRETSAVDMLPGMRMKAMQLLLEGLGDFGLQKNLMISIKTYEITKPSCPNDATLGKN